MFIGFCKYFCPYTDKFHNGTNDIYLKHFFPIKLHHHPHDEYNERDYLFIVYTKVDIKIK